jgi:hypothetical protein
VVPLTGVLLEKYAAIEGTLLENILIYVNNAQSLEKVGMRNTKNISGIYFTRGVNLITTCT